MDLTPDNNVNGAGNTTHENAKDAFNSDKNIKCISHLSKMAAVNIEFNDMTYSVPTFRKESKMLLKGVSGQFKSGELTAILGPSGAGKSTLLNVLAGYKCTDIGGSISINGQLRDMQEFKKMSCYIMQNDLTQPNLTVFEAMSFAADLKLGKRISRAQKCVIINDILTTLKLIKTRNITTDKLSGGEKKKLIIALELINNPSVIFIDEPTTGLDELSSVQCIDILQKLAHFGRTIVCSVHTPSASIFQKFDHVYVVTNGQCVYRDSVNNIVPFLRNIDLECPKHYNPADFIIDISSGVYGFDLIERMVACVNTKLPLLPISQTKSEFVYNKKNPKISWIYQFSTLVKRMIVQVYRNRNYMYLKILLQILLGLLLGGLYFNMGNDGSKALYNFGVCFTCLIHVVYMPMLPVLQQFPLDIKLMKREHFNRWYDLSAYYWALTVINIPIQIFSASIFLSMLYVISGQPLELHRSSRFFGICLMCAFVTESIAYNVASIFNVVNSLFIGCIITCVFLLFAVHDFGDSTDSRPIYRTIFMYMSYLRYTLEALTMAIYSFDRPRTPCPTEEVYCHFSSPKEVIRIVGMRVSLSFWMDVLALFVFLFIFKGTSYYLLKQRVQPNKIFQMFHLIGKLAKDYFI